MDAMNPIDAISCEASETTLATRLRGYQRRYFPAMEALGLELEGLPGPACFLPETKIIRINPSVKAFPKLCAILILHELIHAELLRRDNDADEAEGERFQAEVKRLWACDAYARLL